MYDDHRIPEQEEVEFSFWLIFLCGKLLFLRGFIVDEDLIYKENCNITSLLFQHQCFHCHCIIFSTKGGKTVDALSCKRN